MGNCSWRSSHIPSNSPELSLLYQRIFSDPDPSLLSSILTIPHWPEVRLGKVLLTQLCWSFLHLAVWKGHLDLTSQLLDAGADPIATDLNGDTALHLAQELQDANMIFLLVASVEGYRQTDNEKRTNSTLDGTRPLKEQVESFASSRESVLSPKAAGLAKVHRAPSNCRFESQQSMSQKAHQ